VSPAPRRASPRGSARGRVHDRGESGRIAGRRLLPRRRRRHHHLAELLAPLLRRPRACDGGRERQDEQRCGSVRRLRSLPARRGRGGGEARAGGRSRSRTHQLLPRGRTLLLASAGQVSGSGIILARSLPTPKGKWLRPGSSPLTAAGQRGLRTPFPNRLMSSRALARVCERCQVPSAPAPMAPGRAVPPPPGSETTRRARHANPRLEAPDEQRERVRRAEDALHGARRRALDRPRGARARAAAPWRLARRHPPPIADGGRGSPA